MQNMIAKIKQQAGGVVCDWALVEKKYYLSKME